MMPRGLAGPRVRGRAGREPGGSALRPRAAGSPFAAGLAVLGLAVAGCAAVGKPGPDGRQAVIDRIVATSAKVMIEQGGRRLGSGSGVVVASKAEGADTEAVSYVLTAAHLLDGKEGGQIFVRFTGAHAGQGKLPATLLHRGNADTLDLALLRVPRIAVPPVSLAAEDQVRLGDEVLVVGFPWGRRLGLFSGIVSQVPVDGRGDGGPDEGSDPTITVDAAVANGVSGGASSAWPPGASSASWRVTRPPPSP